MEFLNDSMEEKPKNGEISGLLNIQNRYKIQKPISFHERFGKFKKEEIKNASDRGPLSLQKKKDLMDMVNNSNDFIGKDDKLSFINYLNNPAEKFKMPI
jgi:hypothetical protein